ncbi:hypothetical protein STANM309S_02652 [Streptomyces tanashiensis]
MPLRLAKYGVPLAETAPAGLAAAGIEPAVLPPEPQPVALAQPQPAALPAQVPAQAAPAQTPVGPQAQVPQQAQAPAGPVNHESHWFDASQVSPESYEGSYNPQIVEGLEPMPVPVPQGPQDVPSRRVPRSSWSTRSTWSSRSRGPTSSRTSSTRS